MIGCGVEVGLQAEQLLSDYIQIDTSTHTGNEMAGLLFMKAKAEELGLYTFLQETAPAKGNLVIAALKEDLLPFQYYRSNHSNNSIVKNPPIILLSHVDVVSANSEDWKHQPFSGEMINGEIWGRGAIDAKQIGVTHLYTLFNLKSMRKKQPLIQLITSEEETGSKNGILQFLEKYGDYFKDAIVFNEGGGFPITLETTPFYLVETGQKGNASFTISIPAAKNKNPYLPSNEAEFKLLDIFETIRNFKLPDEKLPHSVKEMFKRISTELGLDWNEHDPKSFFLNLPTQWTRMFSAMSKTTFTVTVLNGGKRNSLYKGSYELEVDARPLPGTNQEEFQSFIQNEIQKVCPEAIIVWGDFHSGYDQRNTQSMIHILEKQLVKEVSSSSVVPFMTIGSNDGRHVIPYGATVIGYSPMTPRMTFDKVLPLVHGVDERIHVDDLHFGIEQLTAVLKTYIDSSIRKDD